MKDKIDPSEYSFERFVELYCPMFSKDRISAITAESIPSPFPVATRLKATGDLYRKQPIWPDRHTSIRNLISEFETETNISKAHAATTKERVEALNNRSKRKKKPSGLLSSLIGIRK